MRGRRALLGLIAVLVPAAQRQRWLEEWRAELPHGRRTMIFGAPKDAWTLRRLSKSLGPALRGVVHSIDARVPIVELETLASLTNRRHFEERITARGLTLLGAIALALATAGLYALVSFMVALRRRELGVRIALGAAPGEILRLVLGQSVRLAVIGGALGGILALVLGAYVHASLLGAPRVDPALFVGAAGVLTTAMALASAVPAWRAARVNPVEVLRTE